MNHRVFALVLFAASGTAGAACGTAPRHGFDSEDTGEAVADLAGVPAQVACLEVDVTGARSVVNRFDVKAGAMPVLSLKGLPLGSDTFSALAYPTACSAVTSAVQATWIADPTQVTLSAGATAKVPLVLHPNGQASVSVGFNPDDAGAAMACTPHTFGSHTFSYPADVLFPSGGQTALDAATEHAYDAWKSKYVQQGCSGYYVFSGGGTGTGVGDTVSEGHGYGMIITALMAGYDPNAQAIFDGMYSFFKKFPTATHQNLMSWTVNVAGGCIVPASQNFSATDGDLDIAYALLLANQQWPGQGYLDKANAVIADIRAADIEASTHLPTLGDWSTATSATYDDLRSSDLMPEHFRAFARASADTTWQSGSVEGSYSLLATMQAQFAPMTGLVPDFIMHTSSSPQPATPNLLEGPADGQFSYNACRVPLRIATDYVASGDARAKTAVNKMNTWIMSTTGGDPSKILDGYTLSGGKGAQQSGPSPAFSSPFAVSAMVAGNQAWLDALWTSRAIGSDYFSDAITMLSMIVLSGNWWAPC
jgi:endo-1,4-beta-D-glucanase Y